MASLRMRFKAAVMALAILACFTASAANESPMPRQLQLDESNTFVPFGAQGAKLSQSGPVRCEAMADGRRMFGMVSCIAAEFSSVVPKRPGFTAPVKLATPATLCRALTPAEAKGLSGAVVVVVRGECAFQQKAQHLQVAIRDNADMEGIAAMVVVNTEPGNAVAMAKSHDSELSFPSLMMAKEDGDRLLAKLKEGAEFDMRIFAKHGGAEDNSERIKELQDLTAASPSDEDLLQELSAELSKAGRLAESVETGYRRKLVILEKAFKESPNPSSTSPWLDLVTLYGRFGNYPRALEVAKEAAGKFSAASVHLALARVHSALGQHEEAVTALKQVLWQQPSHPAANSLMAMSLLRACQASNVTTVAVDSGATAITPRCEAMGDIMDHLDEAAEGYNERGDDGDEEGEDDSVRSDSWTSIFSSSTMNQAPSQALTAKVNHDASQLRYLSGLVLGDDENPDDVDFSGIAQAYEAFAEAIKESSSKQLSLREVLATLSEAHSEVLRSTLGRTIFTPSTMRLGSCGGRCLSPLPWAVDIQNDFWAHYWPAPLATVIEDALTPHAMTAVTRLANEAVAWQMSQGDPNVLTARLDRGFRSEVLLQIALDLQATFPHILCHHELLQVTATKHVAGEVTESNVAASDAVHIDEAALRVILFVTPLASNSDKANGGVRLYEQRMQEDVTAAEVAANRQQVMKWVGNDKSRRLLYRENRMLLLEADAPVRTELPVAFKQGLLHRRVAIEWTFGKRGERCEHPPMPEDD